ncbi:MAG: pyrroline-5-carboxylate reductase [Geminicoccaceae bacterium]
MMPDTAAPLLLVGGGKMGEALLAGWLAHGLSPAAAVVVEPAAARRAELAAGHGVLAVERPEELPMELRPGVLVLAVKPQMMDAALPAYRHRVGPGTLALSIAAGKGLASLEAGLGGIGVVRAMPNTPAAIGRGVSVLCANAAATKAQRGLAARLMAAVGSVEWIEDEDLMHAVTAVSGSGPAYVFHLIEALAEAGTAAGLPPELAMRLARGTVAGAGELAGRAAEPAAQLRVNVTSPGGTTAAALAVLMAADGLEPLLTRAVQAAAERSRALA